jgi:hypothetical protein
MNKKGTHHQPLKVTLEMAAGVASKLWWRWDGGALNGQAMELGHIWPFLRDEVI